MDKLYIVVPAYNEAENIEKFVNDWYPIIEKHNGDGESRIVIVNDGSKDETYDILWELAKTRYFLITLTKTNGGHGSALIYGYQYAIENNVDFIFQTDSDGQTNPYEFEQFWRLRRHYDAIIGNRTNRQDGMIRKFVELMLLFILRCIFGVKIPDSNAPFRLMNYKILKKYIEKMPKDFDVPNVMLTVYFSYFQEKIKFLPITFKPRQGGANSTNLNSIVKIGWKALGNFMILKKHIND